MRPGHVKRCALAVEMDRCDLFPLLMHAGHLVAGPGWKIRFSVRIAPIDAFLIVTNGNRIHQCSALPYSRFSFSPSLPTPSAAGLTKSANRFRNPNAINFLPGENEWYMAAYLEPNHENQTK
jgi:hypothetical protein